MPRIFSLLLFIACSSNAFATDNIRLKIKDSGIDAQRKNYLAIDSGMFLLPLSGSFAETVFKKNAVGLNLAAGYLINKYVFFEVGYSWIIQERKEFTSTNGEDFFGVVANANAIHTGEAKLNGFYLDLGGKYELFKNFEVNSSFGIMRASFDDRYTVDVANNVSAALDLFPVVNKFIYQFTLGAHYNVTESWGVRSSYRYIGTSHITDSENNAFFGDAHFINIGLLYRF